MHLGQPAISARRELLASSPFGGGKPPPRAVLQEIATACIVASHAPLTLKRYGEDWAKFEAFCQHYGHTPLPAALGTVAEFLAFCAMTSKLQSVKVARSAVRFGHLDAGFADPTAAVQISRMVSGFARKHGTPQVTKMALSTRHVRAMCLNLDAEGGLISIRDKACLLLAYAAALRASEVVARRISNVEIEEEGMKLVLASSKTDRERKGISKHVVRGRHPETDPVLAMEEWLEALRGLGVSGGPLFPALLPCGDPAKRGARIQPAPMSIQYYRAMLKRQAEAIGLDPAKISGHSARRGHVTQARRNGASRSAMKRQGGWRSSSMLDRYDEEGLAYKDNSSAYLKL